MQFLLHVAKKAACNLASGMMLKSFVTCGVSCGYLVHEGFGLVWFSTRQDLPISYVLLLLILLRAFQLFLLSVNFSSGFRKEAGLIIPFASYQAALLSDFQPSHRQQESLQTAGVFGNKTVDTFEVR